MERLEPGSSLKQLFPHEDEQATEIAASVIRQLHAKPQEIPEGFPTMEDWFAPLFDDRYSVLASEYDRVQAIVRDLLGRDDTRFLCHGDLHHENILLSKGGWISIDPKGVIAPLWFEIGCFMRNPLNLLDKSNTGVIIERRFDQFAELLGIERGILVQSSYVQAVLAASWVLQEGGDGNYSLRCALLMKPT